MLIKFLLLVNVCSFFILFFELRDFNIMILAFQYVYRIFEYVRIFVWKTNLKCSYARQGRNFIV